MLISKFFADGINISEELKAYSNEVNISFPDQLSAFLAAYNGGETPRTTFSCGGESSDVVAFYGLGDVKYSYSNVRPFEWEGKWYLPIAFDSFGNDIVISTLSGAVYFRDHETSRITQLTDDLRAFIQACTSKGIDPDTFKSIQEREQDLIRRGRGHMLTDALRNMWQAEIDKYSCMTLENVTVQQD